MTNPIQLTATQTEILKIAAYRPEGQIEPLPPQLRGGARTKVIDGLLARGLIIRDTDTSPYCLTDAGYAAVGRKRPQPVPAETVELDVSQKAVKRRLKIGVEGKPRSRENSKQASVIAMLKRPEGATIAQVCAATDWQAHTVRGTFAGTFKKKLGLTISSTKPDEGERIYRII